MKARASVSVLVAAAFLLVLQAPPCLGQYVIEFRNDSGRTVTLSIFDEDGDCMFCGPDGEIGRNRPTEEITVKPGVTWCFKHGRRDDPPRCARSIEGSFPRKMYMHVNPVDGLEPAKIITIETPCCPSGQRVVRVSVDAGDFGTHTALTSNMSVTHLRVFEGPFDSPDPGQRSYGTRFDQATTRSIHFQVHFAHPQPGRRIDFDIDYRIYGSNGLFAEGTMNTYLEPDWYTSYHSGFWGWAEPGNWPAGHYRIELFIRGERIAGSHFEISGSGGIVPGPPPDIPDGFVLPPPDDVEVVVPSPYSDPCPASAPSDSWDLEMGPAPITRWYWDAELGMYCGYLYGGTELGQYRLEPVGSGYFLVLWNRDARAYDRGMRLDRGERPDPSTGWAEKGLTFALRRGLWEQVGWWFIRLP